MSKQRNTSLDILKGVSAIMIILIHAPVSGWLGQMIIAVARSAVALFFMISGYFAYVSSETDIVKKTKRKLFNILKLMLFSYLFYLLWGIFVRTTGTGVASAIDWLKHTFTIKNIFKMIFIHIDIFAGHLWFLNALAVCYALQLILKKRIFSEMSAIIAVVLLSINFLSMNILPVFGVEINMSYFRNAWFYGIPIFIIGGLIRKFKDANKIIVDNRKLIWCSLCFFVIVCLERVFLSYSQLYLGNVLLLLCVFIWSIQNPAALKNKFLLKCGREYSTYIYVLQWAVINIGVKALKLLKISEGSHIYMNLLAAMSVFGTIFAAAVISRCFKALNKANQEKGD